MLAALATISLAGADTLRLRDGRTVQGSYLGGSARQIRMAVGDAVQTFDVSDIASIRFESSGSSANAAPAPVMTNRGWEIPSGSAITVRMIDEVDSKVNNVGQTFRASVDDPVMVGDREVIPRGADATVKMVELKDPNKITGGGQLTLELDSIVMNGRTIDANTQGVATVGESRKGESTKVIGGAAALGAIIGAIAGGGKGAAIGGISGAGAGTAVQVLTQGTRVRVPSETRLTFTLQQPIPIQ
jgi:hypothetical protein